MKTTLPALALLALAACIAPAPDPEEVGAYGSDALSAQGETLWPRAKGVVPIPVCWLPAKIAPNRFPLDAYAPPSDFVEARKAWAREIVTREWTAKTPLRFTGWADCGADRARFVQLQPIDSTGETTCGEPGRACAEGLGRLVRGRRVFLNLFFGDEFLYSSDYRQTQTLATYRKELDLAPNRDGSMYWLPAACLDELRSQWTTNTSSKDPRFARDLRSPSVRAEAMAIIEGCTKHNVLHEFGHVAGFAHEQYRADDPEAQRECLAESERRGLESGDDAAKVPASARGNVPLGPFDPESIMSYCRSDPRPTLSRLDVLATLAIYGFRPIFWLR